MPTKKELMVAVRSLRKRLRQSQTEFGKLLGKGLSTIFRYETLRPPTGQALVRLTKLAADNNHHDLATIFQTALVEKFGLTGRFWDLEHKDATTAAAVDAPVDQ